MDQISKLYLVYLARRDPSGAADVAKKLQILGDRRSGAATAGQCGVADVSDSKNSRSDTLHWSATLLPHQFRLA
jgi:hypothetical protein